MNLTENEILTRVGKEELDQLCTELIEVGQADPIAKAISGGRAEIATSVDPFKLEDDMLERLWLSLAVPLLYPRRAELPKKHKDEQTWARQFLADVRDGKYPNLIPDATATVNAVGNWGSKRKICTD